MSDEDFKRRVARVLRACEWASRRGRDNDPACPACNAYAEEHHHDCELAALLREAEA